MGTNPKAYIINSDGSVSETISDKEVDEVVRAFIRVAANQVGKTKAYYAQKKAIKYLEKYSDCAIPETYVQDLQLREFPYEFKRAELGKVYSRLIWLASTIWVSGVGIFGYYWIIRKFKEINSDFADLSENNQLQ